MELGEDNIVEVAPGITVNADELKGTNFEDKIVDSPDVMKDFAYFKLFPLAERQLWKLSDIPWDKIDKRAVPNQMLIFLREIAYSELTTYTATYKFMELFADDLDFTSWLSVWLYEEAKHPLVIMKWLSHFDDKFDSNYIRKGREIYPMRNNRLEMLCMNIVSEITAAHAYKTFALESQEPVLQIIMHNLAVDETRHANSFYSYAKNMINRAEDKNLALLTTLRVLFYCMFSMEQHHPVNELTMRTRQDLADSTLVVGMDNPEVQAMSLHKFSQLTGIQMASKQDLLINLQDLRSVVEGKPKAGESQAEDPSAQKDAPGIQVTEQMIEQKAEELLQQ